MTLPPLSLYVHLPWCERKCPYCDFNSHEAQGIPETGYVDALLEDLNCDAPMAQDRPVNTLFIGGGTPSLFSGSAIERLLSGIRARLPVSPTLEATMEANPGSAEAGKFAAFRQAGINRLSLGVQSFDDHCLRRLGRVHNSAQARNAIEHAYTAGFDNINIDLMHGLPGQSISSALSDLQLALAYSPRHLSWYQLTIEPNTQFYTQPPQLPDETELADIQAHGETCLHKGGYIQYEVSAYSRSGSQCRHNRNYWTFGDYLAIGAGAHGKITFSDGRVQRYWKTRQPSAYMNAATGQHTCGSRYLTGGERVGEFMLNALRLNEGFTLSLLSARTGLSFADIEHPLGKLIQRQLLVKRGNRVQTTSLGRRFLDSVIAEFFPD